MLRTLLLCVAPLIAPAESIVSGSGAQPKYGLPQFHNSARHAGADPYVMYDAKSSQYFAYSTEGADPNYLFAIYSSPDLSTWHRQPGGVLKACYDDSGNRLLGGQACWARDWQWAPETYFNPKTGWYFFFFAGRLRNDMTKDHFRYSLFEEPSKIGVAVSRSPTGPFHEIASKPIDYYPFDPDYHDVNLIMDEKQMLPPKTLEQGQTAPKGTYIPTIDANVFFDTDGRVYLYTSRNAYRNWNWDAKLGKYIEESNVIAVELDRAWWDDPKASTMPEIIASQKDIHAADAAKLPTNITQYNGTGEIGNPLRKDGWKTVISYGADPQDWENYHVNDYQKFNGTKKDRRWSEGSTLITRQKKDGSKLYFITYSANNFEAENYGVGYATSKSPLGPFTKAQANPILSEKPSADAPIYSTGHGSIVASPPTGRECIASPQEVTRRTPPGSELFYVHHARNSTSTNRAIYTTRMTVDADAGAGKMTMSLTSNDQLLPRSTYPISVEATCRMGIVDVKVLSKQDAPFDVTESTNRVVSYPDEQTPRTTSDDGQGGFRLQFEKQGVSTLAYQRSNRDGVWDTVAVVSAGC